MMTTSEMVMRVTPPSAAAAPTKAYIPGVTQFKSVLHSVWKMYLKKRNGNCTRKVQSIQIVLPLKIPLMKAQWR